MRTLYLCYFGLREPLVQTQVLPYLRELVAGGIGVSLLTFEPEKAQRWTASEVQEWQKRLADDGIEWRSLAYHKRPSLPATIFDISVGIGWILKNNLQERFDVLHARGHVPGVMAAVGSNLTGAQMVFDIRGFMPEEYTDAGVWPENGLVYRLVKRVERSLLKAADGFVVLTEKARQILFADSEQTSRPVEVIPCCVSFDRFQQARTVDKAAIQHELGISGRRVLVYVGALGGWYLTDEMADFLAVARDRDCKTFALILTQSEPELFRHRLLSRGFTAQDFLIRSVSPVEIPRYLRAADAALSFIKPCYSKLSSSPTKIAEYLASGLPVISNAGIGDLDDAIRQDQTGVIFSAFDQVSYHQALAEIEKLLTEAELAECCQASARRRFDLKEVGGTRYRRLYQQLRHPDPQT